jgi:Do/DeqQ family serine protease
MKRLALILTLLSCGVVAGLVLAARLRPAEEATAAIEQPSPRGAAAASQPAAATAGVPDFSRVADSALKAVTNISSRRVVRTRTSIFADDPFFRRFFGDDEDLFGYRDRVQQSLGSGVVVSADGYVLTNTHVVGSDTAEVTVTFADTRELDAQVVGVDELTDIALLKVDARDLPTLAWGDSDRLKIAEWVLAIGNPFSIGQTVTLGIVSATNRSLSGQIAGYENFIQTDAAINPGNSGGALVNSRGELVGINTAIFSRSGGYQGIGFAVPSNLTRRVMADLQKYGSVRRGSIGRVDVAPLTTRLAQQLGVEQTSGAVVWQMSRTSAAYEAGIRPGDVIVKFNGRQVDEPAQFVRMLADTPIGSTVTLGVVREGREIEFKVRVQEAVQARD